AFQLADAGIQYAEKYLNQHQILWSTYASPTPQPLIPSTTLTGLGTFTVSVQDGGNGSLRVTSTGNASNNAQAVITGLVVLGPYVPEDAVTVDQDLTISGNATLAGSNGGVHANGNLTISSSPVISTNAIAYFNYTATGTPNVAGVAAGSPTEPDIWTSSCPSTINGTLYFQTDVSIPTSLGTTQAPWVTTLIAEGSIDLTAQSLIARAPTSMDGALFKAGTQNFLFISDEDIHIGSLSGGNI